MRTDSIPQHVLLDIATNCGVGCVRNQLHTGIEHLLLCFACLTGDQALVECGGGMYVRPAVSAHTTHAQVQAQLCMCCSVVERCRNLQCVVSMHVQQFVPCSARLPATTTGLPQASMGAAAG